MTRVAIVGANGRLGLAVAKAFLAAGHEVIAITRSGTLAEPLEGAEVRAADAMDRASVIAACEGAEIIFNGLNPPYTDWQAKCLPMLDNVLAAVKVAGATHLFPGNVYNFGHAIKMETIEDAPQPGSTRKGTIRVQMEKRCEAFARDEGVQTLILRAGDFYGGTRPGAWLDLMIAKGLKKDRFTWPGPADQPHAFAYLPDLARAFVALADKRGELPDFERFHFKGHTLTGEEMQAAAKVATGRKLRLKGVNWTLYGMLGLVVPMLREINEMAYLWRMPHSLDGTKLEKAIGAPAITPPDQAMASAIADLKLDGE